MKMIVAVLVALLAGASSARAEPGRSDEGTVSIKVTPSTTAVPEAESTPAEEATTPVECRHEPLHGGSLVPIGDEWAHVEITFDPATGIFVAYFLDGDALEPVRLRQEMFFIKVFDLDGEEYALLAGKEDEETGEKMGDTSVFWGGSKKLIGKLEFGGMIDMLGVRGRGFRNVEFSYPR